MSRLLSRLDVASGAIEINIWLIDHKAINKLVKYDSIVIIQVYSSDNRDKVSVWTQVTVNPEKSFQVCMIDIS